MKRVDLAVDGFEWDESPGGNVEHLRRHAISPEDVAAVLAWRPLFYRSDEPISATHLMVGRDGNNRSLLVFLRATPVQNVWKPVTGWRGKDAHDILEMEGRI